MAETKKKLITRQSGRGRKWWFFLSPPKESVSEHWYDVSLRPCFVVICFPNHALKAVEMPGCCGQCLHFRGCREVWKVATKFPIWKGFAPTYKFGKIITKHLHPNLLTPYLGRWLLEIEVTTFVTTPKKGCWKPLESTITINIVYTT